MIKRKSKTCNGGNFRSWVSELHLVPTEKYNGRRRVYRLDRAFIYSLSARDETDHLCVNEVINVPPGFETDMASIPMVCQLILGGRDNVGVAEAAVFHDFLCHKRAPAFYANSKMRCIMEGLGVPRWKVAAIFLALHFVGYGSAFFNGLTFGVFKRDYQRSSIVDK